MAFSLSGTTITQTGTDTNLSGLTGLSGVTSFSYGSGDTFQRYVNIGDRLLEVRGNMTVDAQQERLIIANNARPTAIRVKSGGTLTLVGTVSYANGSDNVLAVAVESLKKADTLGGGTIYVIFAESGGTLNITDCAVLNASGIRFDTGSTVNVTNGAIILRDLTPVQGQQFQIFNNPTVDGLTVLGHKGSFRGTVDDLVGFSPRFGDLGIGYTSTTDNASVRLHRFFDYNPIDMTTDVGQYGNAGGMGSRFVNASKGTGLSMRLENSNGGVSEVYKTFRITVSDTTGAAIQNALFFIRDVNNGNRSTIYGRDYTPDRTYTGLTDVNGQVTEDTDQNGLFTGVRFALSAWDRRSKSNDSNDEFDVPLWSYPHVNFTLADIPMKGLGRLELSATLLDDLNITESNRTTVDAYTALETLTKLYDRAKSFKVNASNVEYPSLTEPLIGVTGTDLDLGVADLVVDNTAVSTIAVNTGTNVITIDAPALDTAGSFTGVTTTGDITFDNGADIGNGITLTAANVRLNQAQDLTDVTINGNLRIATGANSTLNFNNVTVTGSVFNDSAGNTLTINNSGGSLTAGDAGTGNGQTDIQSSVPISITVVDTAGTPIQGARVFLETTPGGVTVLNGSDGTSLTDVNGQVTTTFGGTTPVDVTGRARRSTSSPLYKTGNISGQITGSGLASVVVLVLDE